MTVILFSDDGRTDISAQMRAHYERLSETLTDAQMKELAYVEGALLYGTAQEARAEFSELPTTTQQTQEGQILMSRIARRDADEAWFAAAQAAMRRNLGGKTKYSRTGNSVIFARPQCGRHDLSSSREFAQAQMRAADIEVACDTPAGTTVAHDSPEPEKGA